MDEGRQRPPAIGQVLSLVAQGLDLGLAVGGAGGQTTDIVLGVALGQGGSRRFVPPMLSLKTTLEIFQCGKQRSRTSKTLWKQLKRHALDKGAVGDYKAGVLRRIDSGGTSTNMNPNLKQTDKRMKTLLTTCVAALVLLANVSTSKAAEQLPYTEGSVFEMTFIRILQGGGDAYLKFLQKEWIPVQEAAKKEGLILSYHVRGGMAANKDDWDMVLIIEYKNMAALDGLDEKYLAVAEKVAGSNKEQEKRAEDRNKIREVVGSKLVRELIFK